MNARCWASEAADAHAVDMARETARADEEDSVAVEIGATMRRALCGGEFVTVPHWTDRGGFAECEEIGTDAIAVLFDHIGDDAALPMLAALLRTDCPEARALVQYAAEKHAKANASDILNIRERVALEM